MIEKIILFGATGMLGNYIYSYFKQHTNIPIIVIYSRITEENIHNLHFLLNTYKIDNKTCVINCIGQIPQRMTNTNKHYYFINGVFPNILWQVCKHYDAKLIQPTTDCVFSGKREEGNYNEFDTHDDTKDYGISKSLGEPCECTIIRTSIIGRETRNKRSFMEWVINSKKQVIGWDNHYWNGITCLEYSKLIEYIIKNDLFWSGVRHIYSPTTVSKYDLVTITNEVFNLSLEIKKETFEETVNRSLCSIYPSFYEIPEIKTQINDLKNFKLLL